MSTLDEITKEKQRLSEALARVDAQRVKLTSQLTELEATERVLARYSKGTQTRKTLSGKTPTTATQAAAPARQSAPWAHRLITLVLQSAKPRPVPAERSAFCDAEMPLASRLKAGTQDLQRNALDHGPRYPSKLLLPSRGSNNVANSTCCKQR